MSRSATGMSAKRKRSSEHTKWYAVKTLYRWTAAPSSRLRRSKSLRGATLIEERVVLVRAAGHDEAIARAKVEGAEYRRGTYMNPFGQRVRIRNLPCWESHELFGPPGDLQEAFSATELVDSRIPLKSIIASKMGKDHGEREDAIRFKFADTMFVRRK
jgi:hypothetical protein